MKGDFTRFTHDPGKHYTRVLKQQGRVDLDADWNELNEILTQLDRTESIDVIGRCGAPLHSNGFKIEALEDGSDVTIAPGRFYVDGILCSNDAGEPVSIGAQEDLPGYPAEQIARQDGVYLAYLDVWERHVTALEDPEIREVALGGPDTTTRTQTVCQVRLYRTGEQGPLDRLQCRPFPAVPNTGELAAQAELSDEPDTPCVVPAAGGYRGLDNRHYRVEIHDAGKNDAGVRVRTPTFKWSRDNGSVVLPIADDGIDANKVTLKTLGPDEVLTVQVGDWVEVLGDETELNRLSGTLARVVPDGIDKENLKITLSKDVSAHAGEGHLKLRRWDHPAAASASLVDGAIEIQEDWFDLEDGVQVRFKTDDSVSYDVGDYWSIPARTREGTVLWPRSGTPSAAEFLPRLGIEHHYCTLALLLREDSEWKDFRDCRPVFRPLTEIGRGGCCVIVHPGEDVQQAIDTVVAAGGGCVRLCAGVHTLDGDLLIRDADNLHIAGMNGSTVFHFREGGLRIESSRRVAVEDMLVVGSNVSALISLLHDDRLRPNREIRLSGLVLLNLGERRERGMSCAVRVGHARGVEIEDCRMVADAGILGLMGNDLPDLSGATEPRPDGSPAEATVTFDDLEPDQRIRIEDEFEEAGVKVTGIPFERLTGGIRRQTYAQVKRERTAAGVVQYMQIRGINLRFVPPEAVPGVGLKFAHSGNNVSLQVNHDVRHAKYLNALDGKTIGGVKVRISARAEFRRGGTLTLEGPEGSIRELAIGGEQLDIDDVEFRVRGMRRGKELRYGEGVHDLSLVGSSIRFGRAGILAMACDGWNVVGCDIRPFDDGLRAKLDQAYETFPDRTNPAMLLQELDGLFATAAVESQGVALDAFLWRDCTVRDCLLGGMAGAFAFWWIRGRVSGNTIRGRDIGLGAFWAHDTAWSGNRLLCTDGTGIGFTGSYRLRAEGNHVRGLVGMANLPFGWTSATLRMFVSGFVAAYGGGEQSEELAVRWMLIEQSVGLMGLDDLMQVLQDMLEEVAPGVPATVALTGLVFSMLEPRRNQKTRQRGEGMNLPVIDLRAAGNDFACGEKCVTLEGFIPLGSLRIADNRIHTTTGQAVRLTAPSFLANAHLTVLLYRSWFALMLRQLDRRPPGGALDAVIAELRTLAERWQLESEGFLELDLRVEGNTVRSLQTAIESNLFELAVRGNHITLQERQVEAVPQTATVFGKVTGVQGEPLAGATVYVSDPVRSVTTSREGEYRITGLEPGAYDLAAVMEQYVPGRRQVTLGAGEQLEVNFSLEEWPSYVGIVEYHAVTSGVLANAGSGPMVSNLEVDRVLGSLEASDTLEPLALSMREGGRVRADLYTASLMREDGPLSDPARRSAAANAVSTAGGATTDPALRHVSGELARAMRSDDSARTTALLEELIDVLQYQLNNHGIVAEGAGCRIVDNHVLVPGDARAETRALGGIDVSVDFVDLMIDGALAGFVLNAMQSDEPLDPLLGVTETLIENNEVIGGVGHGISLQAAAGRPEYLHDVRVRGNQVSGLGGSGIFLNEHAYVIGLTLEGNRIINCGRPIGSAVGKGGIILRSAAICRLHGNEVRSCGQEVQHGSVYGVDLDTIYGLDCLDNAILSNGSARPTDDDGGLRMVEVYGSVNVHDNRLLFNRGRGLIWENSAQPDEEALLPAPFMQAVNFYLRSSITLHQVAEEEQASLQGNVFKAAAGALPVFRLLNLREVGFSGNSCHGGSTAAPLGEIHKVERGVVANNLLRANGELAIEIRKMLFGIVHGNAGNQPIGLEQSPLVNHGMNNPPAIG